MPLFMKTRQNQMQILQLFDPPRDLALQPFCTVVTFSTTDCLSAASVLVVVHGGRL